MIKAKGLYEWKLINADTGEIDKEGQQWNTVSDRMIDFIFVGANTIGTYTAYSNGLSVQLSDTVPTPGVDYRRAGASNSFNILAIGSLRQGNVNFETMSKYTDYNFSPPGSPRTIRVLGVKIYYYNNDQFAQPNFVSFVELSTPITQNTNQYFYVKYTINFSYLGGGRGYNTPNNRYIPYGFNNSLFTAGMLSLGRIYGNPYSARFWVTQFLPPSNIDNMMRAVQHRYVSTYTERTTNYGNTYGATLLKNFAVGDIPGPVGAVLIQGSHNDNLDGYYTYFQAALGYSPSANITPSVSRVFLHPQGRESAYFSDPTYPASSQGTALISGTPTTKYTIIGRIRITKTGDASDLVDEIVNSSAVDIDADTITVTQDIGLRDKYRLTTTGTLPSPLVAGTDYYIIKENPTTIKLATTYSNAQAGIAIDITSSGTGDHTLTRQNTGQYRLELSSWPSSSSLVNLHQLSMGIDYDGYVMPQDLNNATNYYTNYAEGDYIANTASSYRNQFYSNYTASMIRGAVKKGDYIYTVQQSRKGLINNVCRWLFNTVETSQPLCKFGTFSTRVVVPIDTGTKMYIFTNEGVYEYTYATPTVAPVLLTITGLIETDILDACWDPITGYFWTGHVSGLSRIDIGALTAKQYLTGAGQELEGMTANEVLTACGQLEAYNGRVLRGGMCYYDSNFDIAGRSTAWVLQDGVGYYRVYGTNTCYTCCLRKDTNQIIWTNINKIIIYDIIVTGKNMGSSTQYSSLDYSGDRPWCKMSQYSKDNFIMMYIGPSSYSSPRIGHFKANNNTFSNEASSLPYTYSNDSLYASGEAYSMGAFNHCKIDLDGNGTLGFIFHKYLISIKDENPIPYGWDGSTWVKDNPNSRNIPKTSSHPLLSGLAVNFNNATGGSWDLQFISGEQYTFVYGPTVIKDNLQTMQIKTRQYVCATYVVENYSITVPSTSPYTITIPEVSDPDFRDMDPTDFITFVYEGATRYTAGTDPLLTGTYKADTSGVFSFSSTDAGKNLTITYTYSKFTV